MNSGPRSPRLLVAVGAKGSPLQKTDLPGPKSGSFHLLLRPWKKTQAGWAGWAVRLIGCWAAGRWAVGCFVGLLLLLGMWGCWAVVLLLGWMSSSDRFPLKPTRENITYS